MENFVVTSREILMKEITPAEVRAWRKQANITQQRLGEYLGLKKIAVTKIELGHRQISGPEQKLLRLLIKGELPFSNSIIDARSAQLSFTENEWRIIYAAAQNEGYEDAKEWIVDKIRSYLRMSPKSKLEQMAAESPNRYNKKK